MTFGKALSEDIFKTLVRHIDKPLVEQMTVSTIHSFACKLVKKHYQLLGFARAPRLLKTARKHRLINRIAKNIDLSESELGKAFSHYSSGKSSKVENSLGKRKAPIAKKAYKKYLKRKKAKAVMNFNDMVAYALQLVKKYPAVVKETYEHLMVDELQDINGVQQQFLLKLSEMMKSTVMVGDPLQLIYQWRQASPRYWTELEEALDPKPFALTQSFRIPELALQLVNNLGCQIDKKSPKLTSKVEGEKPMLIDLVDQDAQHRWLAKEIKALLANNISINQIAILGKTRKELSQTAIAIRERGIAITELYSHDINEHKQHLQALIQLTALEQKRTTKQLTTDERELACRYIENLWLGEAVRQQLKTNVTVKQRKQGRDSKKPEAILKIKSDHPSYKRINNLSNGIKKAALLTEVESAIQCLIDASKPVLKDHDKKAAKLLLRDLADIKIKAIKARKCTCLDDVKEKWFETTVVNKDEGVQLMTCHSAKGQQWDYVFILNVVNGVFPRQKDETKIQEEKRVLYVAVTRHHKKLYLLQTPVAIKIFKENSEVKAVELKEPSPFIDASQQGLVTRRIRPKKGSHKQ